MYFDVPMTVERVELTEIAFGSKEISVVNPYDEHPLQLEPRTGALSSTLRAFASYYREGVNSNSPAYSFLCFYKIIEGVRANRRRAARRDRESDRGGRLIVAEQVPSEPREFAPWLNRLFPARVRPWDEMALAAVFIPEATGRTVDELVVSAGGRRLTAGPMRKLRDDMSHSLWVPDGTASLSADEGLHLLRVEHWLPITKCVTRLVLLNEFAGQSWEPIGQATGGDRT